MKLSRFIPRAALGASLVMSAAQIPTARAYDLVGNGGGAAERTIVYAFQKLDRYLQFCLDASSCKINARERDLLQKILADLPTERAAPEPLRFLSERKNPGTFELNGEMKVAKTGNAPGSPIYFNVDLLYTKTPMGSIEAANLADATAMLVHELGHHQGDYAHTELDLLGVKVSLLLQNRMFVTPLLPFNDAISAFVINPQTRQGFPDVVLHVYDDVVDISAAVARKFECGGLVIPIPVDPLPDINVGGSRPLGASLHNLHWERFDDDKDTARFAVRANLSNFCKKKDLSLYRDADSQVQIKFKVRRYRAEAGAASSTGQAQNQVGDSVWRFDPKSLDVNLEHRPWWKIIHLPF